MKNLTAMGCKHAGPSFFPTIAFSCAFILALTQGLGRFHSFWPLSVINTLTYSYYKTMGWGNVRINWIFDDSKELLYFFRL